MSITPDNLGIWVGPENRAPETCFVCKKISWTGPFCNECRELEEDAEEIRTLGIYRRPLTGEVHQLLLPLVPAWARGPASGFIRSPP